MSTIQLLFIAMVGLFVCAVAPYAGWVPAFLCAYLISLGGVTTALYVAGGGSATHYGVAPSTPTLWLGDVALAGAMFAVWAQGGRLQVGWLLAGFVIPTFILLEAVWGGTPEQWSGFKLYVTAFLSFAVGRWLGANITENAAFILACVLVGVCALQLVATVAQSQGVMLLRPGTGSDAVTWISSGRMVGLYGHPAILGKVMFLLFCFLLPLTTCQRDATRRLAYIALGFASLATLLTLSRANTVAIGIAIIVWVAIGIRSSSVLPRLGVIVGTGAVIAANGGPLAALKDRQFEDPHGGFREPILQVGLAQIAKTPLAGTGPNYYGETVGQYDKLAARGFPLHNSFLYPVAELGIPLAMIFFLPLLIAVGYAIKRVVDRRSFDAQSGALFAIVPGVVLIAWTGWGLVATEALPLWFMGFGFLAGENAIFAKTRRIVSGTRGRARYSRLGG